MSIKSMFQTQTVLIFLAVIVMSNCKSTSGIQESNANGAETYPNKEGYVIGQVSKFDVEGACAYAIKTEGEDSEWLDPTNLGDEFKQNGLIVVFSFTSLRMANRCEKARPIEVIDMSVKEED